MTSWHRKQALSVAALASAALVAVGSSGAGEYEPFRTDFPQVAPAESYKPFETDFGITRSSAETSFVLPAKRQQQAAATTRLDVSDVVLGAGLGLVVAALAAIAALALRSRRSPAGRWQSVGS